MSTETELTTARYTTCWCTDGEHAPVVGDDGHRRESAEMIARILDRHIVTISPRVAVAA